MFGKTGDPKLDRFLEVTGRIDAHSLPAGAWGLAYATRDALRPAGRFDVVPDVRSGVLVPTILASERSGRVPHLATARRLAQALNLAVDEVFPEGKHDDE
jgi:hypothetical protein